MKLNRSLIGQTRPGGSLLIDRSRLRLFAKAIGQTNPIFFDVDAARRAGHPDLPVPPTFYLSVELEVPEPLDFLSEMDVDLRSVLHGGQSFQYHGTAHAGDELSSSCVITDMFEKKGGALTFLITESPIINQDGVRIATLGNTIIVRQMAGALT